MTKKKVLVIAAHPDDEIVGCGGTLLKLKKRGYEISIIFISDGVIGKLKPNASNEQIKFNISKREDKARQVGQKLKCKKIYFLSYPNLQLHNSNKLEIVKKIIKILNYLKPDTVFIHSNKDLNPDHRISNEISITALRPTLKKNPKQIFAFEIPSSTDWALNQFGNFQPNLFFDIKKEINQKMKLLNIYKAELWKYPHPLSKEYIKKYANICGSVHCLEFCERFEIIKIVE